MLIRRFRRINIMLGLVFLFAGCSDSTEGNKSTSKSDAFLSATINGEAFSSSLEIVTFKANSQTYLATADNKSGVHEYEMNWIIQNDKANDPSKIRFGFIELKDPGGDRKKNKTWALPDNFDFKETGQTDASLEGTFSFTADAFVQGTRDTSDQLIVTNGKFRANIKGGY